MIICQRRELSCLRLQNSKYVELIFGTVILNRVNFYICKVAS